MTARDKQRRRASALKNPGVTELASGRWRCQVMANGRRISVTDDDPVVARTKALAIREGLLEEAAAARSLTVGAAMDQYIDSKSNVLSPSTLQGYRNTRKVQMQDLMAVPIDALTQDHVQRSINVMARTHSPKTVRNAHGLLSAVLSVYRPSMQLHTTLPQRVKQPMEIPTVDEVARMQEAVRGTDFELPFLLAAWLGLRTSEIRGLTWDCIEGDMLHIKQALVEGPDGPALKQPKSYAGDRYLHIPDYIAGLLDVLPHTAGYLVPVCHSCLYKQFRRLCKALGLPAYRFHDLRHYAASYMLAMGIPDKYIMERLGHATTWTTKQVYQHTFAATSQDMCARLEAALTANLHTDLHTPKSDA